MTRGNAARRRRGLGRRFEPIRRKSRPVADRVSPELWDSVWARDRECIGVRMVPGHQCSDGRSVDHFHWIPGGKRGKRAASRLEHLIAMCRGMNVSGPPRAVREEERRLARLRYPDHGTETGCVCDGT